MGHATIDFETKSECDLKKAGAWAYSEHPSTEVTFLGYSLDGGPKKLWQAGNRFLDDFGFEDGWDPDPPPYDLFEHIAKPDVYVVAHNNAFEKAIWTNVCEKNLGWPSRKDFKWMDTMAIAAYLCLPLQLERLARVLNIPQQKDMEGAKANMKICKPNSKGVWCNDREVYRRAGEYCLGDIDTQEAILQFLGTLTRTEHAVWELDQIINERGIQLDMRYVSACEQIIKDATKPLANEFASITGGLKASQREKVMEWIRERLPVYYDLNLEPMAPEEQLPNMKKDTIAEFIQRDDLPAEIDRLMEIRGDLTSTSISKISAMRRTASRHDSRARFLLQYHAAGPGRWAGRLLQPHNFPRGTVKADPEELVQDIFKVDAPLLVDKYRSAIQAISTSLRHGIIAKPGHILAVGDFSSIEARIVLALAGQHDKCELIANGVDIYNDMATTIFGYEVDRKNPAMAMEGILGKSAVLGCGFQMGWNRFMGQVKEQTGLELMPEQAQQAVTTYRKEFAPKVPKLWYALQDASTQAVWDRRPVEAFGIEYKLENQWLTARLPSGRKLHYFDPRPVKRPVPWDEDDIRQGWTYMTWKEGRWQKRHAYGGLLTENVVQGTARDIMVDRMFAVEFELRYPIILTVHDELVTEPRAEIANAEEMEQCMNDAPAWARERGIPVASECWVGERYKK